MDPKTGARSFDQLLIRIGMQPGDNRGKVTKELFTAAVRAYCIHKPYTQQQIDAVFASFAGNKGEGARALDEAYITVSRF